MISRLSSSIAAAALMATLGCTKILPPLTAPEAGGAPWRELVSKHVVLRTDREDEDAREALVELEQTIVALHDLAFPNVDIDNRRLLAVHFDRERDYTSFYRAGTAGTFVWRLPNDLEPEPTMIVWGKLDASARTTLQHELTHLFVRSSTAGLPPWLNEGLAEYYETLAVEDGHAYLGRPMQKARAWPQTQWRSERVGPIMRLLVPIGHVPPVADLVSMDQAAFYVWTDKGRQPTLDEQRKGISNYLGAFGLVHLLMHDPAYQPRYDRMMELAAQGSSPRAAWDTAFADVEAEELELAYRQHMLNIHRFETMVLRTAYEHRNVTIDVNRVMDPAEVHLLWARLRPWSRDPETAKAEIATAVKLAPSSAEVAFWTGVFELRQGSLAAAASEMTAAVTAKPDDPRYLHGLAIAHRELATTPKADTDAAQREADAMARLGKLAKTGTELNTVADHHGRSGRWDEALVFAQRAVKADPTCFVCFVTLGEAFFAKQQPGDAAAAQTIALSLLPDGVEAPEEDARLRKYLLAAGKKPAEKDGGGEGR